MKTFIQTPEARYKRARTDVHNLLLSRTQQLGQEWMLVKEIVEVTGHDPGTIHRALADLGKAGLVNSQGLTFRARGTLATPGPLYPKEGTMTETPRKVQPAGTQPQPPCNRRHQDPAEAAEHRKQYLRKEALAMALQGDDGANTHEEIVVRAKVFEEYLSGTTTPGGILTLKQAVQIEKTLEDANVTIGLIDAPDALEAVFAALKIINTAINEASK